MTKAVLGVSQNRSRLLFILVPNLSYSTGIENFGIRFLDFGFLIFDF